MRREETSVFGPSWFVIWRVYDGVFDVCMQCNQIDVLGFIKGEKIGSTLGHFTAMADGVLYEMFL